MLDFKMTTFLTVVELGSYTAAANKLNLTQPAVSQHIQKLEEYYGCPIFAQEGRAMRLTPQGEKLLHYAHLQHSNENQLLEQLAGVQKQLRLGSTLSIADYYLPSMLAPYASEQNIPIKVIVANTSILLKELLNGNLDAAFIEGIFDRTLFESIDFCRASFIPVVSSNHPLTGMNIKLSHLHHYPLILREQGSGTRAVFENYLSQQNDSISSFKQIWEISSFILIKRMLEGTHAISFMYEAVAEQEIEKGTLTTLNIKSYSVSHPLHFVYLKNSLEQQRITRFYSDCISSFFPYKNI